MNKLKYLGLGILLGGALAMTAGADDKGAAVSDSGKSAPSRIWWAYQPVQRPADPVVKQKKWVRTPIDAFVLAKLEAKNLKPSSDADRARAYASTCEAVGAVRGLYHDWSFSTLH